LIRAINGFCGKIFFMEIREEKNDLDILILAAGLGTRMRSDVVKVLHELDGRPLIDHVCRTAAALAPRNVYVVVGHQGDAVRSAVSRVLGDGRAKFAVQTAQNGTGDAVNSAREFLENEDATVLVLSGDVPMIRPETLSALIARHRSVGVGRAACSILSVDLADPFGYGRIIRDINGNFEKIVEQKDATDSERAVSEINSGIYCFDAKKLFAALKNVRNNNSQGEYYLTDVPALLRSSGETVLIYKHGDAGEIEGANNRMQLADLERFVRTRTITRMMLEDGVTFVDPKNAYISEDAVIGRDTVIFPNVTVEGDAVIGKGCVIRAGTRIVNSKIADGVEILDNCLIADSTVGEGCKVGPMAHLRGNAVIADEAKVGNFVELKKTTLGKGSKANHLTYLGDATIGERTNIGAGTITCNYDGKNKHRTNIGSDVRIGSDTMLVAPVSVGDGAVTGAGSVVTKDVEAGELVVGVPAKKMTKA
jgi:bifunctional UDP-N-acetylglucosamine pyrophosphorylase/glucosamine-1-phosphate N-acetyltransferase